ncbi:MAG TPA: hypothetical protein VF276_10735 [Chloroflexia bacterium]
MNIFPARCFKTPISLLVSTVAAFEICCALPFWAFLVIQWSGNETLSAHRALYSGVVIFGTFFLAALIFWVAIAEPLRKERNQRQKEK